MGNNCCGACWNVANEVMALARQWRQPHDLGLGVGADELHT
jgi:hypothetical protein